MDSEKTLAQHLCENCGGAMQSGPIGPQCIHCLLSFATADERFADVAELFPELDIRELIANGGFGSVFRAEQRRMKRPVALKFLGAGLSQTAEAVELFEKEMVSVASLSHPGIVQAYDAGDREGQCYIVMELVDGEDCGSLIRQHGRLPIAESCEIIRQAAVALDFAHGKGLVHRDVKPGNLMVSKHDPTVKVLDFGLACIGVTSLIDETEEAPDGGENRRFLGTLEYIAPEQIAAPDQVDAKADIYALGATLRRMLTGKPAREGMSDQTLMLQMETVTSAPVAPISTLRADLPSALSGLCDSLVALDRGKRPATAAEVARLLEPWCEGAELERLFTAGPLPEKPFFHHRKKRRRVLLALATCAVIAGGAALIQQGKFLTRVENPAAPALQGVPVFSENVRKIHKLPPVSMPRLFAKEWKVEREISSVAPGTSRFNGARLMPDGCLVFIHHLDEISREVTPGGERVSVFPRGAVSNCGTMGVHPETGALVWSRRGDPDDKTLIRYRADGTALVPIGPDFSSEASEEARAAMRADRRAKGDTGGCAYVWGFAFVTEGNFPPDSGLRAGDVLYADEGHVDLALYPGRKLFPRVEASPGLWKFRFDDDSPAKRIGSLSTFWIKGHTKFPIDVTVSRHGVFLLNRNETAAGPDITENDYNQRIMRWQPGGFKACPTDLPIHRPIGIAADPLSEDLYVAEGGIDGPTGADQRVLRLRPDGKGGYKAEIFASGFMSLSHCGIQITADGQHMVITDERLAAVAVLKREVYPGAGKR